MDKCRLAKPEVAMLDLGRDPSHGLALMRDCLAVSPDTRFILLACSDLICDVVTAMRAGAFDYLSAPVEKSRLKAAIAAATSTGQATANLHLRPPDGPIAKDMIAKSSAMQKLQDRIKSASAARGPIFITGESGTGKHLCAQAIHRASPRANAPFVILSCAGLSELANARIAMGETVETQTWAITQFEDAMIRADGGSLFINKLCELCPTLQAQLLRFLETSVIRAPDTAQDRAVDVRIICATAHDPVTEVNDGRFRADLFYRLHVLPIHVPPLRNRGDDILALAEQILIQLSHEEDRSITALSDEARAALLRYHWPGNVRELANVLRQVVVMHRGTVVTSAMLPAHIVRPPTRTPCNSEITAQRLSSDSLLGRRMTEVERLVIEATISDQSGSVPRAAEVLGLSPSTIYRKRESWR